MKARRWWGWPLVPVYAAALAGKEMLLRVGMLRTRRLQWPVVSVGSLSAGGAGKTPIVIALAELLETRGWSVNILSRGYGREARTVERVDGYVDDAARRFGDEPTLIAQRTGVPVWVGADRFTAGVAAETDSAGGRSVHLMDDGFQHRKLARAMEVVLLTADDLEDALLPAGNRREPFAALRRADAIVVREEEREQVIARLQPNLRKETAIWVIRRQIRFPQDSILQSDVPTYGHLVFAAIARPSNFLHMLREAGVHELEMLTFPDHHPYTDGDMNRLVERFNQSLANGFITTEKDAVKLSSAMRARLEAHGTLLVARLETSFLDEAQVMRDVEARIS